MAEYYPLLAKAVASLPNSTPEIRRVVYERARKALIGQLRTLHPPVPDEDIERESVELDRAVERLEAELAVGPSQASAAVPGTAAGVAQAADKKKPASVLPARGTVPSSGGSLGPPTKNLPLSTLRTKVPMPKAAGVAAPAAPPSAAPSPAASLAAQQTPPKPAAASAPAGSNPPPVPAVPAETTAAAVPNVVASEPPPPVAAAPLSEATADASRLRMPSADARPRSEGQRPIAPQPVAAKGPKRRMWIIPVGVGLIVALVGGAAYKLRDRPEHVAAVKPAAQTQAEAGKIAERVGGKADTTGDEAANAPATPAKSGSAAPVEQDAAATAPPAASASDTSAQQTTPAASNPELPVAHRAALLIEAPDQPNKVKTFLGNVVWKLNNVSTGPSDAVGLAVEADVDLPDDKTKAIVTFEKNIDSSLPASHTIKVRFTVLPGSVTGDVKQISVPQMRREDSPSGEPLAGVTVPVVQNSFLVGLSPGNAETANIELLKTEQWIDIPMLLDNGKIAKLTFEKSDSGQRDLSEAIAAWQKS